MSLIFLFALEPLIWKWDGKSGRGKKAFVINASAQARQLLCNLGAFLLPCSIFALRMSFPILCLSPLLQHVLPHFWTRRQSKGRSGMLLGLICSVSLFYFGEQVECGWVNSPKGFSDYLLPLCLVPLFWPFRSGIRLVWIHHISRISKPSSIALSQWDVKKIWDHGGVLLSHSTGPFLDGQQPSRISLS